MDIKDIPPGAITGIYGPVGSGKSYTALAMAGRILTEDDGAIVCIINTEYRGLTDPETLESFGCDPERVMTYTTPEDTELVFDKILELVAKGAPVKTIIIDTVTSIGARIHPNQPLGYMASLLTVMARKARNHDVGLILVSHVRRNMDPNVAKVWLPMNGVVNVVDYLVNTDGPTGTEITKVEPTSCDGCQAGRPVDKNGNHRMGDGEYPDLMGCQKR
jgi:RecA/RadA recombinase